MKGGPGSQSEQLAHSMYGGTCSSCSAPVRYESCITLWVAHHPLSTSHRPLASYKPLLDSHHPLPSTHYDTTAIPLATTHAAVRLPFYSCNPLPRPLTHLVLGRRVRLDAARERVHTAQVRECANVHTFGASGLSSAHPLAFPVYSASLPPTSRE